MGQLVFQATLGGQVNLVGPNTASTFNINVPAIAGTMVTTGDTGTVTSTMLSTTTLTASAATTASSNKGAFNYGTLNFSDTGIVASYQTSVNSYFQNVMQNTSAGASASAEFIAYNDQGTATTNYATVGINSSGYSGTGSINAAGYAYLLSGSTDLVIGTIGSNKIHFTINSGATDAMLIDTAGNLGLGVTPSAWGTLYSTKAFQISASSVVMGDINSTILGTNYYYDSAFATKYIKNNYALQYVQDGSVGIHKWFTAPSGTAGNAITFTQAMTLDASGNLGIGITSPAGRLHLATANDTILTFTANSRRTGYLEGFDSGSPVFNIFADGGGTAPIAFGTNGTERARIDSSGNLLVGTTSGAYKLTVVGANTISASGWGSGIGTGMVMTTTVTGANSDAISFNQNATQVGHIQTTSVGTTLYLGTSDSRLKIDNGVSTDTSVIDNTVIHEFTWKQNNVADRGVFAQEAFLVKPHAVYKGEDTVNEDGSLKSPWGVDYSKYVPDLIVYAQQLKKTMQEQQSLIESLTTRLAALESK